MIERRLESSQAASLRERAEKNFRELLDSSMDYLDGLSPKTLQEAIHELRVHQIELEMQNEDLLRAQADLDASRARYFDLYDLAPVGYCTASEKGLILEANLTAGSLLRVERGALVGRRLSAFIAKEDQELYYLRRKKLLDTSQPQECDLRMVRPDGTAFFAHLEIAAAQDENGAPVCRVALMDVTASKRISAVLQARVRISEYAPAHSLGELLTLTLDEAELLTGSTIGFFHFVEADQLTLSLQEWSTNTRRRMCTAEGGGRHYPVDEAGVWADALRERRPVICNDYASLPHRKGLPPGHSQVVRMLVVPILQNDKVMALLGIGNKSGDYDSEDIEITSQLASLSWDIAERKILENTLRESEMHFRTLADSGEALIWTSGIDKKCNYFNRVWLDFTGRSLEQELGDGWTEGVHPDDLDSCFRTYVEAFDRRTPFNMDYRLRRHDGEYRWLQDQGTPRYSSDGDFLGYIGHCLDITDRKQTEEFLRESESRYAQLAEQSLTVAWEVDAQGLYTYVSQVSETVSGYRPDELVGRKHFYDLHPESGREEFKASAFAVFARKQPFVNLVNALQTKDGRQVWVSTNGAPLLNAEGTLCGYRGGDTDITKREKAETLLRASEARFRSFFELPLHGRCITSPEKGWLEVNDRLCEILGYTGEEILQKTWAEMTHPGDLAADVAQFDRLLSGEIEQYKLEKRFVRKDGSTVWTEISVGGVRKSDGTVDHLICVMEDITERIKAVLELGVLEEHHRDILQTAMDGFCQLDTEGRIQSVNASFCRMTGYSEEELMTMGISDLEAVMTPGNVASNIRKIIAKGGVRFETRHRCKDGKVIDVEVSVQFRPHDNTLVSFHHDITKRKEMDAKILVALDRAESANRAKSDFLGVMSHELCTPLNGVLGFAQLLAGTPLDSEQKDYAETISNSGEHLLAIVSDILDFSSIEKGTLAIHVAPLAVADLVKAAEDTVRKSAAAKGLELRCELAAGVPEQITGDERRIRQILINLLGNAVKFTASGSVVLRVAGSGQEAWASRPCEAQVFAAMPVSKQAGRPFSLEEECPPTASGGSFLDFCVEDTGIGISSETLDLLFHPFVQADSTKTRKFGGVGLGLAISKRIAEAMGGSITAASILGGGSTFTFRFPLESVCAGGLASVPSHISDRGKSALTEHRPPVQAGKSPTLSGGPLVLIVDDDQASSVIAGKMLQKLGYSVEFAASGDKALKAFAPGKYLAILMDMSMPVMDGLEATGKIREVEAAANGHVPIIAFTANVMPGDRELCLEAGMDDFLSKPFKRAELAAKLAGVAQIS
ncbi:MAG: PAS domain S-box protein [Verrucomicrobiae bacterium]